MVARFAWVLVVALGSGGGTARAQQLEWNEEEHPRYSVAEGAVFGGVAIAALVWTSLRRHGEGNWLGGVIFDDGLRDAFRPDAFETRRTVARVSDVGLVTSMALPLADVAVAWGAHDAPDVAAQMLAIDLGSYATSFLLTQMTKDLSGRERPDERQCRETDGAEGDCNIEYRSFFSGHTSMAFTGAGLTCAHHSQHRLWGSPVADRGACIGALTVAAMTGLFRVIADKHYATDVLAGATIGLASGWLLPVLLHYGWSSTW